MSVVVQCFHCDTILELDEGFRGGVCRCSTCGSLLQVPKASGATAPKARPAAPGAVVTENKRPASPNEDPGLSRGAFDAARQNPSSASGSRPAIPDLGGSSSGLRGGRPAAPVATQTPRKIEKVEAISGPTRAGPHLRQVKKNNTLLYVGLTLGGLILVVVVIVLVLFLMSPLGNTSNSGPLHGHAVTPNANASGNPGAIPGVPPGAIPATPAPDQKLMKGFLGIPVVGQKVLLSIDGASSMADTFDYVRQAAIRAAGALEPGQLIRIAVWKEDGLKLIPASGFVGKADLKQLRDELMLLSATGSSDAAASMKSSATFGADQVIFVTAKFGLDTSIADTVMAAKSGEVRFDGIKIENDNAPSPLEILAKKTGGTFEIVSTGDLEQTAH